MQFVLWCILVTWKRLPLSWKKNPYDLHELSRLMRVLISAPFFQLLAQFFCLHCHSIFTLNLKENKIIFLQNKKKIGNNLGPMKVYNVGVLMTSLDSPFDLERCGPAVDLALNEVNEFLALHNVKLNKVQGR